jgi:hypothetical protein
MNPLKSKTSGKLPIPLEEYMEYSSIIPRKTGKSGHVTG